MKLPVSELTLRKTVFFSGCGTRSSTTQAVRHFPGIRTSVSLSRTHMEGKVAVVGLISDTHGVLDRETLNALKDASTEVIVHAGDVGDARRKNRAAASEIIATLTTETHNRVVAVAGNVDEGVTDLPAYSTVTVLGKKILILHICNFPPKTVPAAKQLIDCEAPDIVVFGHSHVPGTMWHEKILYINPGSAGPKRFKLPRCLAFLSVACSGELEVVFKAVTSDAEDVGKLPDKVKISNMLDLSPEEHSSTRKRPRKQMKI